MAIIKRCVICEEKLVHNRCPLCGLDHTRQMKIQYRLNTSRGYTAYEEIASQGRSSQKTKRKTSTLSNTSQKTNRNTNTLPNTSQKAIRQRTTAQLNQPRKTATNSSKASDLQRKIYDASYKRAQAVRKKQESERGWAKLIPSIIAVVFMVIGLVGNMMEEVETDVYVTALPEESFTEELEYVDVQDLYENGTRTLSETGDEFKTTLTSGEYIVGVHLPEGYYDIKLDNGWGYFELYNPYNNFKDGYDFVNYSFSSRDVNELIDYPLYQGTRIILTESAALECSTKSAQMQLLHAVENPNPISTDSEMVLEPGTFYYVGVDIPAGVYDFKVEDGDAIFRCGMPEADTKFGTTYRRIEVNRADSSNMYRNIVLLDGMYIYLDQYAEGTSTLTPSAVIDSDGFESYYEVYPIDSLE